MNIHIPTAWMKITIVRTATRTVGGNLTKKETFGLWDGHEIEIVVDPTSPSSVLRYAYITGFEVGHEIKVKGQLRIKELKLSLIVQQMNYANVGDKESAPEEEEYNSGKSSSNKSDTENGSFNLGIIPAHKRPTESDSNRSSSSKRPRSRSPTRSHSSTSGRLGSSLPLRPRSRSPIRSHSITPGRLGFSPPVRSWSRPPGAYGGTH